MTFRAVVPLFRLVAAGGAAAAASAGVAIVPDPPPRVCTEYGASDFVFIADVLSHRRLRETSAIIDYEHVYRLRVARRFKGKAPRLFTVYTSATSAGEQLEVGRRYVLFAQRRFGRPTLFGGGNNRSGAAAARIVTQLLALRTRHQSLASIRGRLDLSDGGLRPAGFLRVELARSDGARRRQRSDASGFFYAVVPPGVWQARIVEPGWTGRTGVYSFQDIGRIKLVAGGCADLEIETVRAGR